MLTTPYDYAARVLHWIHSLNIKTPILGVSFYEKTQPDFDEIEKSSHQLASHRKNICMEAMRYQSNKKLLSRHREGCCKTPLQHGMGNCAEMTMLALVLLCYLNYPGEVVHLESECDHAFLALLPMHKVCSEQFKIRFESVSNEGRLNYNSLPNDFLILDPLFKEIFCPHHAMTYCWIRKYSDYMNIGGPEIMQSTPIRVKQFFSIADYKEMEYIKNTLSSFEFKKAILEIQSKAYEANWCASLFQKESRAPLSELNFYPE